MITETYLENENRRDLRIIQEALSGLLQAFDARNPQQIRAYRYASQVFQKTSAKLASATVVIEGLNDDSQLLRASPQ